VHQSINISRRWEQNLSAQSVEHGINICRNIVKDKAQHAVILDKTINDKLQKDVQSYRLVTVAVLVDRLKINGSLARRALADLEERGVIKPVITHSACKVWSESPLRSRTHCEEHSPGRHGTQWTNRRFSSLQLARSVVPSKATRRLLCLSPERILHGIRTRISRALRWKHGVLRNDFCFRGGFLGLWRCIGDSSTKTGVLLTLPEIGGDEN
jgi:small subunit ribosomal protein S25e